MAHKKNTAHQNIREAIAAGNLAKEESRYEDAIADFQSALRMKLLVDEEARVRCQLAEAFERCGMYRDQLESIIKFNDVAKLARFSSYLQITLRIQLGRAYTYNNDVPRAIALLNQALSLAYQTGGDKEIGDCHYGLCSSYIQISEMRIARDYCESALECR